MTDDAPTPQRPPRRGRRKSASERVRAASFPVTLRGYERAAVDAWVEEVAGIVADLEGTQSRDSVVKAALDEVGEHTGDILKKAHEAADEITTQSRSQAEGRLQRAESEAETLVRDAEARARDLEGDTQALWEERTRLIEDLRQLSDQVLGLADDASDRIAPPGREEPEAVILGGEEESEADTDETARLGTMDQPTMESAAARPDQDATPPDEQPTQRPAPGS